MPNMREWSAEALVGFATGEAVNAQVDRQDAIGELLRRLYSQEKPCTEWGRGVDDRLEGLEEEVEAGLSSLGEQVDRLDKIIRDIFERPEVRGLGEAPDMGSTLDQEELLSSIDRHLREAERHLVQAEKEPYQEGHGQRAATFHTGAARAHADTARAQAALLSCVA